MSLDNISNLAREVRLEQAPTYAFVVDGNAFPYLLSESGPVVTRVSDGLFTIGLKILLFRMDTMKTLPISCVAHHSSVPNVPVIDGEEFPWLCDDSGFKVSFSHKEIPSLTLTMYARNVIGNYLVTDTRPPKESLWTQNGGLIGGHLTVSVEISPRDAGYERIRKVQA